MRVKPQQAKGSGVIVAKVGQYVALYCRISEDKGERGAGVKAQEKWGRAYAAQMWPGVEVRVFSDNDLSGGDLDVFRPGYERLRAAIGRGEVAHLWTVEQSRLERDEARWFKLAAELYAAGVVDLHTRYEGVKGVLDLAAGLHAVVNAQERRKGMQRLHATLDENAAAGRPAGGSRMFGYTAGLDERGGKTRVIVPAEADIVRWAAERLLAGWSLEAIARDMRARGIRGVLRRKVRDADNAVVFGDDGRPLLYPPGEISGGTVRSFLTAPAIAGYRVQRGAIIGTGVWEPILTADTWNAVRDRLASKRLVRRADGKGDFAVDPAKLNNGAAAGRKYLLTGGLARCGVCGAPLTAWVRARKQSATAKSSGVPQRRIPTYACHRQTGGSGCVSVKVEDLEGYVVGTMLDWLDQPEVLAEFAADDQGARRAEIDAALRAMEGRGAELARAWGAGALKTAVWTAAREGLAEDERALRADLAALPAPLVGVDISDVRGLWPDMTLDERREVLGTLVTSVTVLPLGRSAPRAFNPARVVVVKRDRRRDE